MLRSRSRAGLMSRFCSFDRASGNLGEREERGNWKRCIAVLVSMFAHLHICMSLLSGVIVYTSL